MRSGLSRIGRRLESRNGFAALVVALAACSAKGTENRPDGRFTGQFKSDFGYDFVEAPTANNGFTRDIQKLLPKLAIVDNNAATTIGGGGTPRQPLAPPLQ